MWEFIGTFITMVFIVPFILYFVVFLIEGDEGFAVTWVIIYFIILFLIQCLHFVVWLICGAPGALMVAIALVAFMVITKSKYESEFPEDLDP